MRRRSETRAIVELRHYWSQWYYIVELFARSRRARRSVDPGAYEHLHTELVETCRVLARLADDGGPNYFRELELLALPWVSTKSFQVADRQILSDLLARCHEVDRQLGGRARAVLGIRSTGQFALRALVAACLLYLFLSIIQGMAPMLGQGRGLSYAALAALYELRSTNGLFVVAMLVVAVSTYVANYTMRH